MIGYIKVFQIQHLHFNYNIVITENNYLIYITFIAFLNTDFSRLWIYFPNQKHLLIFISFGSETSFLPFKSVEIIRSLDTDHDADAFMFNPLRIQRTAGGTPSSDRVKSSKKKNTLIFMSYIHRKLRFLWFQLCKLF